MEQSTYIVKYFVKIQDFKNALFIQSHNTFYNVWDIIIQANPAEQQINNVILFLKCYFIKIYGASLQSILMYSLSAGNLLKVSYPSFPTEDKILKT